MLTDLPNRALLNDRLTQAIVSARRHGTPLAVLFVDLDRFKHVNDSFGHAMGDVLLQSVAHRLLGCVRSSDMVSRLGGDEFVVVLSELDEVEDAAITANKVLTVLAAPHSVAQHDLEVTVSIGVSTFPHDGQDAETLIKKADTAMYHAKENGHNNYQFFEKEMNARAVERQALEGGLRHALERQEFVLHYQPKVNLETGAISGAEALIRWLHPDRGLVPPSQFVPIAEDSGLILPIGARLRSTSSPMYAERETLLAISLGQLSLKTFRLPSGVESVSQRFGQTSIPSVLVILLSGAIPVPSLQIRSAG